MLQPLIRILIPWTGGSFPRSNAGSNSVVLMDPIVWKHPREDLIMMGQLNQVLLCFPAGGGVYRKGSHCEGVNVASF